MTTRYFFSQDESSHWYMIPEDKRELWEELNNMEDGWDDERWCFDEYRTGGGIEQISFENPLPPL